MNALENTDGRRPSKIVFACAGSLGEIYPMIALAAGMKKRGHQTCIAAPNIYEAAVSKAGLEFHRLRPDISLNQDQIDRIWRNVNVWIKEIQRPALNDAYADLMSAMQGADMLVSRHPVLVAPQVAEMTGAKWVTTKLAPAEYMSRFDPVLLGPSLFSRALYRTPALPNLISAPLHSLSVRYCHMGIGELRKSIGLAPSRFPDHRGAQRPDLELVMFSKLLGTPMPDWPAEALQTGAIFMDEAVPEAPLDARIEKFLCEGAPPVIFALGSLGGASIVQRFLRLAIEAVDKVGARAILLCGSEHNRLSLPADLPPSVLTIDQAPFGQLFARGSVLVTHGGVGTVSLALRSGKPQIIWPYTFDQPDNAARLERIGLAQIIYRHDCSVSDLASRIHRALNSAETISLANHAAHVIANEHGLESACQALEHALVS